MQERGLYICFLYPSDLWRELTPWEVIGCNIEGLPALQKD